MAEIYSVDTVKTNPFEGQKPGTSGLRKTVSVFQEKHYTENFLQCMLDGSLGERKKGATLVIGGDGRYLCPETVNLIIKMAAANGLKKLIVGQNGFLSTPAVSCLIRKPEINEGVPIDGGIILTASHNPGGPKGDFGIKYNCENGGPAPESITEKIFQLSTVIESFQICPDLQADLLQLGTQTYQIASYGLFTVKVIDSVDDYSLLLQNIFDFVSIRRLFSPPGLFRLLVDSMHGATGPYVVTLLGDLLGVDRNDLLNTTPLPDFGGGHPDPNLTYARQLVTELGKGCHDFGAAFDGDGDRNMILGKNAFFVTPGDSLAIIAANLDCIPYFRKNGVKGYARSMPTSRAIDRVAAVTGRPTFQVPTGWKFFGNLMDANRLSLCGEESFGTGSDHIREKDGLWALFAWLQIVAHKQLGVEQIVRQHWATFGRNPFTRYDYERVDASSANLMMAYLEQLLPSFIGQRFTANDVSFTVKLADNFQYTDPVDGSVTRKQGLRLVFEDDSRIVIRLSGTGSSDATVRLYIDSFVPANDADRLAMSSQDLLKPLILVALEVSKLEHFTGRNRPTVIT